MTGVSGVSPPGHQACFVSKEGALLEYCRTEHSRGLGKLDRVESYWWEEAEGMMMYVLCWDVSVGMLCVCGWEDRGVHTVHYGLCVLC